MSPTHLSVAACLVLLATAAGAEERKLVGRKKESAPRLDLGLPAFQAMPTVAPLERVPPPDEAGQAPRTGEGYEVTSVRHARPASGGRVALLQVGLSGRPPTTERFNSTLTVRSPGRRAARVEAAIVDPRGVTVMESAGLLTFRRGDGVDLAEWTVEWGATAVRGPGEYQFQVRISGEPVGHWPIKFAETPK